MKEEKTQKENEEIKRRKKGWMRKGKEKKAERRKIKEKGNKKMKEERI